MAELAYVSWGLIPADTDPASRGLAGPRPPMMTAVAVDRGYSLVWELASHQGAVNVRLEATALSVEGRPADCFEVYSGSADSFSALSGYTWEKSVEGISGIFTCALSGVGSHLKLRSKTDDNLVVTGTQFTTP